MYMLWVYRYLGWFMLILGFNTLFKPFFPLLKWIMGEFLAAKILIQWKSMKEWKMGHNIGGLPITALVRKINFWGCILATIKLLHPNTTTPIVWLSNCQLMIKYLIFRISYHFPVKQRVLLLNHTEKPILCSPVFTHWISGHLRNLNWRYLPYTRPI